MAKPLKRVAVTGGAGQIAYSLLFRIANGDLFGPDQPIALRILEVPAVIQALEGVKMELQDCAFPLLKEIYVSSNPNEVFMDAQYAILVGAKPRGPGMERGDLLHENGKIFIEQGQSLNAVADENVKVLVVGNPCNTNCLIAMSHAPRIPKENFHAMTRLDQNRAVAQLAEKGEVAVTDVTNVTIWGNHSSTQVPDYFNAKIKNEPVLKAIYDHQWLEDDFINHVQKRGAAVIAARGKSSAASAANAVVDAIRALETPTEKGHWFSSGVWSAENPYGIDENLIFSFPCRILGQGKWEIVKNIPLDESLKKRIKISEQELIDERHLVKDILGERGP